MNPIIRTIESLDWMTLALVLSMLVMTLGKYLFQTKFLNFLILPFNNKYIMLSNKKGRLLNWFHIFMTIFQFINLSLFIFLINKAWNGTSNQDTFEVFLITIALVIVFQTVKIFLQLFKAFAFNTQELVWDVIYNKTTYFNHSSLVMFLSNIILIYILNNSKTVIYIAIGLILLINAIGLIKLVKNHQKVIVSYLFYFILYLCALEIAPLVVIGSYLKG
ncbi:DUF4271 domain-containing protein [Flagellimonas meridianipacifica]|uniref:Uncharacterized protein DUF4271 n=1 Tax=Flagellimonas meridianipacifica TaxID=1080225 RepID=A0A2T0MG23_9FLAO|nr:DUF4271 domain-containing protein [Allomuricauda pacifica]PRX56537.1 uncharacterized protein DUF4271 [Allomuricauda pacifica]